jgi:hypothetical protein
VGKAIYALDALPDDAQLWRIDWIGGVASNARVPSEPLIDGCLARLPKGETNPLSARSRSSETKFVAKIGVGLLPFISTASVWQSSQSHLIWEIQSHLIWNLTAGVNPPLIKLACRRASQGVALILHRVSRVPSSRGANSASRLSLSRTGVPSSTGGQLSRRHPHLGLAMVVFCKKRTKRIQPVCR